MFIALMIAVLQMLTAEATKRNQDARSDKGKHLM